MHTRFTPQIDELTQRYGEPIVERIILTDDTFKPLSSGRVAEVAMVIRRSTGLIVTARKQYYPRHISRLLTGGIEGDETIEAALRREVYEETNLTVRVTRFAAVLNYSRRDAPHRLVFQTFAFLLDEVSGELRNNDSDEQLDAFFEIPADEIVVLGDRLNTLPPDHDHEIGGTWQAWGAFRSPLHQIMAQILTTTS
jgi:ADP-ribose pyrophosphatase YjhB (NUDIX family)